jgi:stringent starvation protein B
MPVPTAPDGAGTSTRPYLIRALHDWCRDNGYTPYIAVHVDAGVRVPPEYVKNREIVLNVGFDATSGLVIGNDRIEFKARFGGIPREIVVPITHVIAIYARENGQGMAFPAPAEAAPSQATTPAEATDGARPAAAPAGPYLALASIPPPAPVPAPARTTPKSAPPAAPVAAEPPAAPVDPAGPPDAGGPVGRPTLKRIK